jgi:hypothetical protein
MKNQFACSFFIGKVQVIAESLFLSWFRARQSETPFVEKLMEPPECRRIGEETVSLQYFF